MAQVVAGRAVVETLGALRPHRRSVGRRPGSPIWSRRWPQHGNDHLVIYGISQGSLIATVEKRKLAEQYPMGTEAPDIDFVMQGTPNLPNGGLACPVPGPLPSDPRLDVQRPRADRHPVRHGRHQPAVRLVADFPLYPLNLVADLNAFLGSIYVHTYSCDVSLPGPDPTKSPAYQGKHGDTSYYFFETQDLPLFGPLRTLGVPEPVIDVVEPFFREIVELGYDRSIKPWEPTPGAADPDPRPGDGGRRSPRRDRRGHQQRSSPPRLAGAAAHSPGADRRQCRSGRGGGAGPVPTANTTEEGHPRCG